VIITGAAFTGADQGGIRTRGRHAHSLLEQVTVGLFQVGFE
jgi:hypothetical protein